MTPLTHAAVGTALYQKLRGRRLMIPLAFLLAFLSHYALDAIPHYEEFGPLWRYRETVWVFVGLGLVGLLFAWLIWRWNRDAAQIWLLLCLWIALGGYGAALWRAVSAALVVGVLSASRKGREQLGYIVAGMLSLSPDFFPASWRTMRTIHDSIHYHTDWGTYLYRRLVGQPAPALWRVQVASPYFLLGWGLEILVEGCVFFGALWILVRGVPAATDSVAVQPKQSHSSPVPAEADSMATLQSR
jgi:hypothetical protein